LAGLQASLERAAHHAAGADAALLAEAAALEEWRQRATAARERTPRPQGRV
jgi:hypothetical protein